MECSSVDIAGTEIALSRCVKFLEVHIDEEFTLVAKIGKTVRLGLFHLYQITATRRCLPTDAAKIGKTEFRVVSPISNNGNTKVPTNRRC